jgi:hypothetical protein
MYGFSIMATNAYGSSQASEQFSLTIVAPPAVPTAPALLPSESNGAAGGETTTFATPDLVGATLPGATVQLFTTSGSNGSRGSAVGTTTADRAGNYDFKLTGPLSPGTYSYRVDVLDQFGDVSGPSATQTIIVVPPPVTVMNVTDQTSKKHQVKQITVVFSAPVNAAQADRTAGIYSLATPGKKGSYTAKNAGIIKLKSATYIGSTDTVVLIPKKPFALTKPVQLLINGTAPSGLRDGMGRLIDGNGDGQVGGNAIVILSRGGVKISAAELARSNAPRHANAHLIDSLLAGGERFGRKMHHG